MYEWSAEDSPRWICPNEESAFQRQGETAGPRLHWADCRGENMHQVKVNFIVNLSVCVYRRRDRNTVSHNPEYKNMYILYTHNQQTHVHTLKVPYYTVFHQYIIGLRYIQTCLWLAETPNRSLQYPIIPSVSALFQKCWFSVCYFRWK